MASTSIKERTIAVAEYAEGPEGKGHRSSKQSWHPHQRRQKGRTSRSHKRSQEKVVVVGWGLVVVGVLVVVVSSKQWWHPHQRQKGRTSRSHERSQKVVVRVVVGVVVVVVSPSALL